MAETHKLEEFQCFDDFYNWYKREMVHFLSFGIKCTNMLESSYGEFWPAPFLSSTMKNAFRTGLDITQGNARYSFSSVNGMGMADTVDSLYATMREKNCFAGWYRICRNDMARIVTLPIRC